MVWLEDLKFKKLYILKQTQVTKSVLWINKWIINQIYKIIKKDLIKHPSVALMDKIPKNIILDSWYDYESHVSFVEEGLVLN